MDPRGSASGHGYRQPPVVRTALLLALALTGAYAVSVVPGFRDGPAALWEVWVSTAV